MTGRLKVYDADIPGWKYVDAAGEAVALLDYIPIASVQILPATTTTSDEVNVHTPTITAIPPEAVAVSVNMVAAVNAIAPNNRYNVYDYGTTNIRGQMMSGKVASHYEGMVSPYVALGGDRQFDYATVVGLAATMTRLMYITGYWVRRQSSAIALSEGVLTQSGTASAPATGAGVDNSSIAVTFPVPFSAAPIVVATSLNNLFFASVTAVTTTGFTLNNANRAVGSGSLGARPNSWIAVGPR